MLQNRQTKRFYVCKSCNIEVSEETALEMILPAKNVQKFMNLAENEKLIKEITAKNKARQKDLE